MLRKRSHQAFTDLEAEEPLSPVTHPLHQEMAAGGSDSDGDQVMGTGAFLAGALLQLEHAPLFRSVTCFEIARLQRE